ncbi:MAG TPA: hypothetical protein VM533_00105 [Fimbriiglobus sp.]|nr:hypothetical protein [Fimbriiglobus sp.]
MRSAWMVSSCLGLVLFAGRSAAQPAPEPKDGKVTIVMTVSPAAPPKPVSKYYLMLEYRDQQPGEKIGGFLRCFMEQNVFFNTENTEKRQKWLDTPLAELPTDVREQAGIKNGLAYDPPYANLMVFMDQAARYTRTEWNEWFNLRHDGIYALLPELQKMRELANVLRLRLRGEVKNGEFVRAVETVKTLFGLAKACEQHPTLIASLVGMAILHQAIHGLEEMVQQPGCPNLFWSFADLPSPVMDLHTGFGGERIFLAAHFGPLLKADRPFSDVEMQKYLKLLTELLKMDAPGTGKDEAGTHPAERFTAWAKDKGRVEATRARLVEYGGFSADLVKTFSPIQVVLTDDLIQYQIHLDELRKWMNLPYPQAVGAKQAEEALKKLKADLVLAPLLVPSILKVKEAQTRTDQHFAYLRTVEAIRLYAHENGGKLPPSLDAIKLPLPNDPVSGKPFAYSVKEGMATLTGENPSPGNERTNRVYEIKLRK